MSEHDQRIATAARAFVAAYHEFGLVLDDDTTTAGDQFAERLTAYQSTRDDLLRVVADAIVAEASVVAR